ncbi:Protein of unknown function [Cotesia congregata]|uniref:MARVEL domain-containing protein n=1 Tax=Cotesia congregata TaxID=51543 RepID=A0A8J2HJ48_COTCN|nr:Protein of unknown function [Cotesia congregata]
MTVIFRFFSRRISNKTIFTTVQQIFSTIKNMADEKESTPNITSRLKGYLRETPFFCKIIELLCCVISVGLIVDPYNDRMQSNLNHAGVIYVGICGYIMINAILILCYLLGEKLNKKTALCFSALGAIMSFTAGIILIYDHENFQNNYISRYHERYLKQILASGIFSILSSVIFVFETYFTYKYEDDVIIS